MTTEQIIVANLRAKKVALQRKRNAKRQRALRKERDRLKQCRQCGAPAVMSNRTGKLAKQCADHLSADSKRKSPDRVYPLRWDPDIRRDGGSYNPDGHLLWWDQIHPRFRVTR